MLQVLAPNDVPGRESFSLQFHAFGPFTLFALLGTWGGFLLSLHRKAGSGGERTEGRRREEGGWVLRTQNKVLKAVWPHSLFLLTLHLLSQASSLRAFLHSSTLPALTRVAWRITWASPKWKKSLPPTPQRCGKNARESLWIRDKANLLRPTVRCCSSRLPSTNPCCHMTHQGFRWPDTQVHLVRTLYCQIHGRFVPPFLIIFVLPVIIFRLSSVRKKRCL